jgi:hypothetical protein
MEEHLEDVPEENVQRRSLTQGFVDEKLEGLEGKDHIPDKGLLELERAVAMLGLSSEYLMEALRRTQSCSSLRSNDSTSAYSRQGVDDQVSEPDSNSQNPAVAAIWQQLAESTTLPDSDGNDENQTELLSWHTAPSNQCPKDKIPLPSQNTDFMARRNMANRNMMRDNIITRDESWVASPSQYRWYTPPSSTDSRKHKTHLPRATKSFKTSRKKFTKFICT